MPGGEGEKEGEKVRMLPWLSVALLPALHFVINCTRKIAANQNAQTRILAL
jgi:hypothetical protein